MPVGNRLLLWKKHGSQIDRQIVSLPTYLLATSEVNANLAHASFGTVQELLPQLKFRRMLVRDLINNPYRAEELNSMKKRRSKRVVEARGCKLVRIPTGMKFSGTRLVKSKSKYPFNRCVCREMRVRTYCQCSPGTLRCNSCFATHMLELEEEE